MEFIKNKINRLSPNSARTLSVAIIMLLFFLFAVISNWALDSIDLTKAFKNSDSLGNEIKNYVLDSKVNQLAPRFIDFMWGRTATFTYLSNTLVIACTFLVAFYSKSNPVKKVFFASVCYITVTFLVFWGLIFPGLFKENRYTGPRLLNTTIVHFVTPAFAFFALFLNRKTITMNRKHFVIMILPVLAWFTMSLILFYLGKDYYNYFKQGLNNMDPKTAGSQSIALYSKVNTVFYSFLNFDQPLFYKGSSIVMKVVLNLVLFVVGASAIYGLGEFWVKVYKIKLEKIK
ncbi:MAGa3780 family membrane protein [Mycoplasma sp. Ms02]|uniref:MAGa3780 family membrane protein n=1 Tax=Mycoplasma sp. Ms02 TaxID=353851 RepID=UPI001C8943BF|nr:hypothetical protein [Mycoplasma sp. Ms02]QZE12133.1 hypothetical protein K4L35_02165 [Mycoplasma sp. Ms02]